MLTRFLFALSLLLSCCGTQSQRNRDEEVIEVCLTQFLGDAKWLSADWRQGTHIALRTTYSKAYRSNEEQILKVIDYYRRNPKHADQKQIPFLEDMARQIGEKGKTEAAPSVIGKMTFSDKIIVQDVKRDLHSVQWPKLKDRHGKAVTIRVAVSVQQPVYSPDGHFAYLRVRAPWSIHSADVFFFLERKDKVWGVRLVVPFFYV